MQSNHSERSMMGEVEDRRSRSSRLSELAEQLGIVAARSSSEPAEDSPEIEALEKHSPAFDEMEHEASECEIQEESPSLDAAKDEGRLPTEIPADPSDVSEALAALRQESCSEEMPITNEEASSDETIEAILEPEPADDEESQEYPHDGDAVAEEQVETSEASSVHVSNDPIISFAKLDSGATRELESETETSEILESNEVDELETPSEPALPASPEVAIAESEPILEDEPQLFETLESEFIAEKLVDQVGEIVNIQRLPKSQPTRVLSKTKAQEQEKDDGRAGDRTPLGMSKKSAPETPSLSAEGSEADKLKKKKRVSLLDSYFKGM